MNYPSIDPVLVSIGPLSIHYYGALYLVAFAVFYGLGRWRISRSRPPISVQQLNDLCFFAILGVIIGGRLGYALFYGLETMVRDWLWLFRIWEGGMSFHGGLLGVVVSLLYWARRNSKGFFELMDFVAPLVPIGLGMGRLGNFINSELPGRVTEFGGAVHFHCYAVQAINPLCVGDYEAAARHLSSIYQAFAEGIVLFAIVWLYSSKPRSTGQVSGLFLLAYAVIRCVTELYRHPDPTMGFIAGDWLTMGQVLSIPMAIAGLVLLVPVFSRHLLGGGKT